MPQVIYWGGNNSMKWLILTFFKIPPKKYLGNFWGFRCPNDTHIFCWLRLWVEILTAQSWLNAERCRFHILLVYVQSDSIHNSTFLMSGQPSLSPQRWLKKVLDITSQQKYSCSLNQDHVCQRDRQLAGFEIACHPRLKYFFVAYAGSDT